MSEIFYTDSYSLCVTKTDKFTTSSISVFFSVPTGNQCASRMNVLARALKNGCRRYPSVCLVNRRLEEMYGAVFDVYTFKKGSLQVLALYMETSDDIHKAVRFIYDVLFEPCVKNNSFSQKLTDSCKKAAIKNLRALNDDSAFFTLNLCEEKMSDISLSFGVCPYGNEQDTEAITGQSLYEFYKTVVLSVPCDIYFTGRQDEKSVKEAFFKNLLEHPLTNVQNHIKKTLPKEKACESFTVASSFGQSNLAVGYTFSDTDIFTALLFDELIGGTDSLLFKTVREKNGFCYSISTSLYLSDLAFIVQCGIEKKSAKQAEKAIDDTLSSICKGISTAALSKAKQAVRRRYTVLCDNCANMSGFLYSCKLLAINESPEDFVEKLMALKAEDISKAAAGVKKRVSLLVEEK